MFVRRPDGWRPGPGAARAEVRALSADIRSDSESSLRNLPELSGSVGSSASSLQRLVWRRRLLSSGSGAGSDVIG